MPLENCVIEAEIIFKSTEFYWIIGLNLLLNEINKEIKPNLMYSKDKLNMNNTY